MDIKNMFPRHKVFTFREISEGRVVYQTDMDDIEYRIEFYPNGSAELEQSSFISDIIAAIDASRYFGLTT
jgi:hypothetical protein